MESYLPEQIPDPEAWLALDEQERIDLIVDYHESADYDLPNITVHAAIHAVVENQLAMGVAPVQNAMDRMLAEGLGRHDALHAIGSVLAEQFHKALKGATSGYDPNESYHRCLAKLTAKDWLASGV